MTDVLSNPPKGTCGKKLEDGQYWRYCGESDMGQTSPVHCENCGGSLKLCIKEKVMTVDVNQMMRDSRMSFHLGQPHDKVVLQLEAFAKVVAKECVHIVALNRANAIEKGLNVDEAMSLAEFDIEDMFGVGE